MTVAVLLDQFATLRIAVIYLTVVVGGLAILFSVIYLGGRAIRVGAVQTRLRAGVVATVLLIILAALDVYLAIIEFTLL